MPKPKKTKSACAGCLDNFYNHSDPMGLYNGKPECWSFADMKIVKRKLVPIYQRPPWNQPAQWVPSCYQPKGYVTVDPNCTR